MQLVAILLASLSIAQQAPEVNEPVKVAKIQTHMANTYFYADETTLVYDLEFVHENFPNVLKKQQISMLLSHHPDNAAGRLGGARVRPVDGRIDLEPGTIAVCNFKLVQRDDPPEDPEEHVSPLQTEPQQVVESIRTIHPWWLIVFEDIEIGAEGTEVYIATSPPNSDIGGRIVVVLRDNGRVLIRHRNLIGHFLLTRPGDQDTMYVIEWTKDASKITVNDVVLSKNDPSNAAQRNWSDHDFPSKEAVIDLVNAVGEKLSEMKSAPSMQLVPQD